MSTGELVSATVDELILVSDSDVCEVPSGSSPDERWVVGVGSPPASYDYLSKGSPDCVAVSLDPVVGVVGSCVVRGCRRYRFRLVL